MDLPIRAVQTHSDERLLCPQPGNPSQPSSTLARRAGSHTSHGHGNNINDAAVARREPCSRFGGTHAAPATPAIEDLRGRLLKQRNTPQPVGHPAQRLAFREVAGKAHVVAAAPAPYPLTEQRPFVELKTSNSRLGAHGLCAEVSRSRVMASAQRQFGHAVGYLMA